MCCMESGMRCGTMHALIAVNRLMKVHVAPLTAPPQRATLALVSDFNETGI